MESDEPYYGAWGEVPSDSDVREFSSINPYRSGNARNNRKHHFISIVYLNDFADERGRVQVYLAERPDRPQPMQPSAIGYENHYYSQKLPTGEQENHRFEDFCGRSLPSAC